MRFTRLRLNGFKSFVDPTDLVIAEGLTGIVGPNGCGKSNLLEALRWVMGENRPTAMRGGGMEDVIFAGTATRPARHFAEVHLTIDNAARLAPAAFNDADHLDISRRITREAGSAYRVQGKEVRARDVQMLFADASTGAHSPALVKQGQIAELINARPTARRRILEEAAGIAGLYQRRHEAELRLRAAEANLARVDDVTGQLAAQIAQLARQARAAARYREIGAALRRAEGLLLWRRWDEARAAAAAADGDLGHCARAAALAEAAAEAAVAARAGAEDALPPCREEEAVAAAVVTRLQVAAATLAEEARQAADRIAALAAQRTQIAADAAREAQLTRDAGDTLARLRAELAELAAAGEGHEARLAEAAAAARAAADVLAAQEAAQAEQAEDLARLTARHQSVMRLVEDQRRLRTRAAADMSQSAAACAAAAAAGEQAAAEAEDAFLAATAAAEAAAAAEDLLEAAGAARIAVQDDEAAARAAGAAAEGAAAALRAETAAVEGLIRRDSGTGAQMLDQVQVAPGHERALGAALGDDLRLPAVAGAGESGWVDLPPLPPPPLPAGTLPLSAVVTGPPALARRLALVGIVAADAGPGMQAGLAPGQRLVSAAGDLWRWDGLRLAASDAPSAAALRLQQMNRLADLRRDLDAAEAGAEAARAAHADLALHLGTCTDAEQAARAARRDADRALSDAQRRLSQAEAARDLAGGRIAAAEIALARHRDEAEAAAEALAGAEAALDDLPDIDAARAGAELVRREVAAARDAMLARRSRLDDLRRQGEGRQRRAEALDREIGGWTARQDTAAARAAAIAERQAAADADLAAACAAPAELEARTAVLRDQSGEADDRLASARAALAAAEAALALARQSERDSARTAADRREARVRAEALAAQRRDQQAEAEGRILAAFETGPAALAERLGADPATCPPADRLESEAAALRRARDGLGAVNLRAEDDLRAAEEEHGTLMREKADLDAAIRALRGGIGSLNREGRERLLAAFDQVNANFTMLFRHLFGGGEARLELVESDDPLEAGLEILCQPPGKKLSVLSLLSGGEQTLTALALIFGVFLANPAPICVLDEVDAPLDDANVTRFCDLMDEMTRRTDTRFLVITHHAVTMSRMDRLFGVTMAEQGVSQLVSVDLRRAAALVA